VRNPEVLRISAEAGDDLRAEPGAGEEPGEIEPAAEGEGGEGAEDTADVAGVGGADAGVVVDLGAAARECNLFGRGSTRCSKRRSRWCVGEGTRIAGWDVDSA